MDQTSLRMVEVGRIVRAEGDPEIAPAVWFSAAAVVQSGIGATPAC
jgi:hypothetical protein